MRSELSTLNLQPVGSGMFSQAYAFEADSRSFILRVNRFAQDFYKDQFAARLLPQLAPRIIEIGKWDAERAYCISERCSGVTHERWCAEHGAAGELALRNVVLDALETIHAVPTHAFANWGLTDANFCGQFDSWQAYVASLHNHKFTFDIDALARESFLQRSLFDDLRAEMLARIPFAPTQKWLLHGDYGSPNIMTDGTRITGVLDWAEARLGDCLSDVADLDFWSHHVRYGEAWLARHPDTPHAHERLQCYLLNIGLGSMLIAAHLRDERDYVRVRERTLSALSASRWHDSDWTQ
jgi:hygromycin-B 4-O-kinase